MKRLTDLSLNLGQSVPHFAAQKFRRQTAHIALIFLRYLRDVHRYMLDGSQMVFVYFGIPEAQRQLLGPGNYFRQPRGSWSSCCIPRFDLQKFTALDEAAQDRMTTLLLEQALRNVAQQAAADDTPIRETARRIRADQFTAEFPIESLQTRSPDGQQTARVDSHIARGFIRWKIEVAGNEQEPRTVWIPDECYRAPDFTESTLHLTWDHRGLALRNTQGRVRFTLPLDDPSLAADPRETGKSPGSKGRTRRSS